MNSLFNPQVSPEAACRAFWSQFQLKQPRLVRTPDAVHTVVFCPTGGGKGVSFVIPFLKTESDSCVVLDLKGENAELTAKIRQRRFGHRVVLLDPYHVVTNTPDTFNPLDFIDEHDQCALDDCNDLAKAIVVRPPEEREAHWNDSAESWISALIATVVQYGVRGDNRSLQAIPRLLADRKLLEQAIRAMEESDCWGGKLAEAGGQLRNFVDKELSSTLTTVARHLRFLNTPAVAASTQKSSFDPADLIEGRMSIFLILPPERMRAQSPLLRLWIGSLLRAVVRGGIQEKRRVHFVLDEAASLGHLDCIDDAIDKYRAFGVRLQLYFQSPAQTQQNFPNGQDVTLLSNTNQIYFSVNDFPTAEQVSKRLGESTIVLMSGGNSNSRSNTHTQPSAQPGSTSIGTTYTHNSNWQQQARFLLKPDEVLQLPRRTAITFIPGMSPIQTHLIRHYEEKRLPGPQNGLRWAATWMVMTAASAAYCLGMLATAGLLVVLVNQHGPGSFFRLLLSH